MYHKLIKFLRTNWWRLGIYVILLGLFIFFIVQERSQLSHLGQTIGQANVLFIILGFVVTALFVITEAFTYQNCLKAIGKTIPLGRAITIYLKRFFLASFLPGGFSVAQYTFSDDLKQYDITDSESHLASTIYVLIGGFSFILFLIPTVIGLFALNQLTSDEWWAAIIIIGFVLFLIQEANRLMHQRGLAHRILHRFAPQINQSINEWIKGGFRWQQLIEPLVAATMANVVNILIITVSLAALNVSDPFFLGVILYVLTILLLTISPIFQGLGLVEISLVYSLKRFGLTNQEAVASTLIYRLFQLWIPALLGFSLVIGRRINQWFQQFPALLTALLGAADVIAGTTHRVTTRQPAAVLALFPAHYIADAKHVIAVAGWLLLSLSFFLIWPNRRAWQLTISVIFISILAHIIRGADLDEILFSLATLTILLISWRDYRLK